MNRALRAATIGVLLLTPVALSGCSAGQINQTATQNRDKYGAQGLIGDLTIRDAALAYPSTGRYQVGDDVELLMVIANPGTTEDVLVSMSGPDFRGVRVAGTGVSPVTALPSGPTLGPACRPSGGGASVSPGVGAGRAVPGSTASGSITSGSATPTGTSSSASPSGAIPTGTVSTTSPLPTPAGGGDRVDIPIPADCSVALGEDVPHVFLEGLTRPLTAAAIVPVTMTFQRAGTITVPFIVRPPLTYIPNTSTYNGFEPGPGLESGAAAGGGD